MKSPLLIALALALGATFWLQQGEDDGTDLVADRRASARPQHADRPASTADRPARAAAPATNNAVAPDAPGAWLARSVQAWQERRQQADALPPARTMTAAAPSAWGAVVPPPPPAPPKQDRVADASPVAPPFPHQWVGRFDDEAGPGSKPLRRAVISGSVSTWVVREGDVIEGQWRVDQIQERLVRLTYLPLQQSQTVAMK